MRSYSEIFNNSCEDIAVKYVGFLSKVPEARHSSWNVLLNLSSLALSVLFLTLPQ